jgi:hypothetical protein
VGKPRTDASAAARVSSGDSTRGAASSGAGGRAVAARTGAFSAATLSLAFASVFWSAFWSALTSAFASAFGSTSGLPLALILPASMIRRIGLSASRCARSSASASGVVCASAGNANKAQQAPAAPHRFAFISVPLALSLRRPAKPPRRRSRAGPQGISAAWREL